MFQYLKDKQINSNRYEKHKEENCWSFLTSDKSEKIEFKNGVSEHLHKRTQQKDPVTLEKNQKNYSLCVNNNKTIFNNKCSKKIKKLKNNNI